MLEQADRSGMRLLARRAREELNAAGARPRRSALSGSGALTPSEHRVAEMAAAGHGNREIAERLYVTPCTVETHLTLAFQKLDIGSRTDLAVALDQDAAAQPALDGRPPEACCALRAGAVARAPAPAEGFATRS